MAHLEKLCAQVPDDFRFCFKVTEDITVKRFPNLPRYGGRSGQRNSDFLNVDLFASQFLEPCGSVRDKIGLLMFEFSRFGPLDYFHGREFVIELDTFLSKLPRDWEYGVETRNDTFLQPEYFSILKKHDVTHVMNNRTRMPSVATQMRLAGNSIDEGFAARFLLAPGRYYEEAVKTFLPILRLRR